MRLDVDNLSFSYGQKQVLDKVSLTLNSGELVTILGANGEGKTTLFRCILGFLPYHSGSIKIDGKDIKSINTKKRAKCIAYIPQENKQTFDYSVKNITLMGLTPYISTLKMPSKQDEEKALHTLSDFGILHLKDKSINSLSGGERQLVFTARSIVQDAKILLFDEPTSSLDYGNQIKVLQTIKTLTEKGYSALVSTHNIEQALNYSTKLILIKNKHIIFEGSADELMNTNILETFYSVKLHIEKYKSRFIVF